MTLLDRHLEQIELSAAAISELSFPPAKIFTNALLHQHDITTLIRDTELHERALFSVPAPPAPLTAKDPSANSNRRNTAFHPNGNDVAGGVIGGGGANGVRAPRRNTAVAAVLGGDMVERIRRGGGGGVGTGVGYGGSEARERGDIDVEVLLKGAEKLCGVYPIPGAAEKISSLRNRYAQLSSSIDHYDSRVRRQATQLEKMSRPHEFGDLDDEEEVPTEDQDEEELEITEEDLRREEDEVRELEKKKKALEDRVNGMEKDLGGLLR